MFRTIAPIVGLLVCVGGWVAWGAPATPLAGNQCQIDVEPWGGQPCYVVSYGFNALAAAHPPHEQDVDIYIVPVRAANLNIAGVLVPQNSPAVLTIKNIHKVPGSANPPSFELNGVSIASSWAGSNKTWESVGPAGITEFWDSVSVQRNGAEDYTLWVISKPRGIRVKITNFPPSPTPFPVSTVQATGPVQETH